MNRIEYHEIERRLRDIPLASAPRDLRVRALDAARRHKAAKSWTSPRQRRWLAALAAVLLVVFVTDSLASHAQRVHLAALLDLTRPIPLKVDQQDPLLAEIIGDSTVPRLEAGSGRAQMPRRVLGPSRLSNHDIEHLMEDPYDNPKNLH